MKQILLTILAIICLIITILSTGLMLCANIPQLTENITRATAMADKAKFSRDTLVEVAKETQGFVAGTKSKEELMSLIETINKQANTQYKEYTSSDFMAADEEYALNADAMTHLEDVRIWVQNARIAFGICGAGALIFCALLGLLCGRGALGRCLVWAGGLIIIALVALGAWAIIDFNGMFDWMHSIFFKEGSWIFNEKSLLICMYPTSFWVCMAAICLTCSLIASILSVVVGKIIK